MEKNPGLLAGHIGRLRKAFVARGRDPQGLAVRVVLGAALRADGTPDLEATLAEVPALVAAGVTMVEVLPLVFCRGPQKFDAFCKRLVAAKREVAT
jgi:hypothetical protein